MAEATFLNVEEVCGAIAYHLPIQAEIDAYAPEREVGRRSRGAKPLVADLPERLMRARDELHSELGLRRSSVLVDADLSKPIVSGVLRHESSIDLPGPRRWFASDRYS